MKLSAAVVSYRSPAAELIRLTDSFIAAVARLRHSLETATVQLHFVDNSEQPGLSPDDFERLRKRLHSAAIEARIVQGHGNVGYGRGHNLLVPNLDSDFHLLLNPDVVFDVDSLSTGIMHLLENPGVVLVSPGATGRDGRKQYLCKRYPAVFTFLIRGFCPQPLKRLFSKRLARFEMRELPEQEPATGVPMVGGCCMLCRTGALQEAGGFDGNYFLYFEDFDLSLRLARLGAIACVPRMKIQHDGGRAAAKGTRHILLFVRSGIRFFNTHGWRWFRQ